MKKILEQLAGGDFRSIGRSNKVVKAVLENQELFPDVSSGLLESDLIVRMRAADAVEKIVTQRPELLQKFKKPLLEQIAFIEQQEVQWHVAQMIPRLRLTASDMPRVQKILSTYLKNTKSNIVRVMSLQALADLALQGKLERADVADDIELHADRVKTPSVRARSRILLRQLREYEQE